MNDIVKSRRFTIDELQAYLAEIFPEFWGRAGLRIEELGPMTATIRLGYNATPRSMSQS
jgi:hypothetical protein